MGYNVDQAITQGLIGGALGGAAGGALGWCINKLMATGSTKAGNTAKAEEPKPEPTPLQQMIRKYLEMRDFLKSNDAICSTNKMSGVSVKRDVFLSRLSNKTIVITARGNPQINWPMVGNGAITFTAGTLATAGAIFAGLNGAAGVAVPFAITTGIPAMGFGLSMMLDGFNGGYQRIPGGVAEALDIGVGGDGTVGQLMDIGSGGIPKDLMEASIMGYGLYNSNVAKIMSMTPGRSFSTPRLAPGDNTRVSTTYRYR